MLTPLARVRVRGARWILRTVRAIPGLSARLARSRVREVDGRTLDVDAAALLALDELARSPHLSTSTPRAARARLLEQIRSADAPPPDGVGTRELSVGSNGSLSARLYVPDGLREPSPGLVFLHGGGWVVGDLETHDGFCRRLSHGARCRVLALDYRLGPEHKFPAAVEDCVDAVRWALSHAEDLGLDPARVGVGGDSAGGNLSAVVALRTKNDVRRPALQVLIYPATDTTCSFPSHRSLASGYFLDRASIDWYLDHYRDRSVDPKHPDLSPYWASDVSGAPPALVVTAGFDPLRDEGEAYARKLEAAGVPVTYREHDDLIHGFVMMTEAVPAARRAAEQLIRDIARMLDGAAASQSSSPKTED